MEEKPDLTAGEVADMLRIHIESVRRWARDGRFPNAYVLPGRGGLRVPLADVEAFKSSLRIAPDE